jgi:hypothetical protein
MRHLKRIRLGEETQMLALPRYERKTVKVKKLDPSSTKKKFKTVSEEQVELKDFMVVLYKNEDRVLTDIIYQFKEMKDFPPSI